MKRVVEGPVFSKEPVCALFRYEFSRKLTSLSQANLTNVHSWKYSGLANTKVRTL